MDEAEFEQDAESEVGEWEEFAEDDGEPIRIEELKRLDLQNMPEDIHISVMDDYFSRNHHMA